MIFAFWIRDLTSLTASKYFPVSENTLLALQETGRFIDFNTFHHYYYEM